jgi:hypothetical protein
VLSREPEARSQEPGARSQEPEELNAKCKMQNAKVKMRSGRKSPLAAPVRAKFVGGKTAFRWV